MSLPGYAPAQKGAFAGGNQRLPSVAPGSYVAPGTLPPQNNIPGGTLPGGGISPYAAPKGGSFGGTPTVMGNPGTNPFAAPFQPGSNPQAAPLPPQAYGQQPSSNPFAAPYQPGSNPQAAPLPAQSYGQHPSNPHAVPSAYGQQPSAPQPSVPNAYGQQPSAPNQYGHQPSVPNAYGQQPSAPSQQAYGQPSVPNAYGQQPSAPDPYGQPSAPNAYGQQPYGQQPYGQQPASYVQSAAPVAKKGSKKGLLIGVGLVVAIGAGIGIAVAMSGGKDSGGVASRDELVAQTLAAYTSRDVDAAVNLMGAPDLMAGFAECKETPPEGDAEKARDKLRERFKEQFDELEKSKVKLELVKVLKDNTTTIAKGTESGPCTMTTDLAMVRVEARVKVTAGEAAPREREWKLDFLEVDDTWYLTTPLEVDIGVDCEQSIKKSIAKSQDLFAKMQLSTAAVARIEKKLVAHCTEDAWDGEVAKCLADSTAENTNGCFKQLSTTQRENVEASIKAIIEQELKAKTPPPVDATNQPPAEPDPPKPPDGDPLPPEEPAAGSAAAVESAEAPPSCTEAKTQIAKLARCKGVSRDLRDGYQKSYTLILDAWSSGSRSPALRDATDKSCATLVKSIVELRKSLCR